MIAHAGITEITWATRETTEAQLIFLNGTTEVTEL